MPKSIVEINSQQETHNYISGHCAEPKAYYWVALVPLVVYTISHPNVEIMHLGLNLSYF